MKYGSIKIFALILIVQKKYSREITGSTGLSIAFFLFCILYSENHTNRGSTAICVLKIYITVEIKMLPNIPNPAEVIIKV